jgi:alpha-ribazole phosphatase
MEYGIPGPFVVRGFFAFWGVSCPLSPERERAGVRGWAYQTNPCLSPGRPCYEDRKLTLAHELVLVRHGYVGERYDGRFVGSSDLPLAERGLAQVATLASPARAFDSAKFLCSPMLRARETADAMLKPIGLTYEVVPDLREIDFGQWECKTFDEISASDPADVDKWAEYASDFAFPGGESISGFNARVRECGERISNEPIETVVAVAHGGVIRGLICHFLGLDLRNYLLFDVKPASISKIAIHDGKGVLTQLNDVCHLGAYANG